MGFVAWITEIRCNSNWVNYAKEKLLFKAIAESTISELKILDSVVVEKK